jgi:hypothetical protein
MTEFTSEDDLETFEGWLKYHGFDAALLAPDELAEWRDVYATITMEDAAKRKVGLMKLPPLLPGEHRYAVAVRENSTLWLFQQGRILRDGAPEASRLGPSRQLPHQRHVSP